MKKSILHIIIIVQVSLAAVGSCSEDYTSGINEPDALIVVDGWIEDGYQAKVLLTTNAPYFTSIDSASIRDLILSQAKVTLDDGENSEVLILRKDSRYFPPYYYAGNTIFGETGKVYTLSAQYGGKSVTSQTTIPPKVAIDSSFLEPGEDNPGMGKVRVQFTDPADEKNYYRIFIKREGKDDKFISVFVMAIDDQYFNGRGVSFSFLHAPETLLSSSESEYYDFKDTILVKLCTMDKASYEFWNSYQDEVMNATNPFASSMVGIKSNIAGDGLGIWGGYGVSIDTIFPSGK